MRNGAFRHRTISGSVRTVLLACYTHSHVCPNLGISKNTRGPGDGMGPMGRFPRRSTMRTSTLQRGDAAAEQHRRGGSRRETRDRRDGTPLARRI